MRTKDAKAAGVESGPTWSLVPGDWFFPPTFRMPDRGQGPVVVWVCAAVELNTWSSHERRDFENLPNFLMEVGKLPSQVHMNVRHSCLQRVRVAIDQGPTAQVALVMEAVAWYLGRSVQDFEKSGGLSPERLLHLVERRYSIEASEERLYKERAKRQREDQGLGGKSEKRQR